MRKNCYRIAGDWISLEGGDAEERTRSRERRGKFFTKSPSSDWIPASTRPLTPVFVWSKGGQEWRGSGSERREKEGARGEKMKDRKKVEDDFSKFWGFRFPPLLNAPFH